MKRIHLFLVLLSVLFTIQVYSQNPKQYYKAGEDFMENKNYADAIDQFTKALEIDPDYADAYVARGYAYESDKQYQKAADDYNRAIVFDDKDEEILFRAAVVNYVLENYEEAKKFARMALDRKSKYLEAYQIQIKILLALEEYMSALDAAKKAIVLKDNAYNRYYQGIVYEALKNYTDAEVQYKKAIGKSKRYIEPYLALASLQTRLNKLDEALEHCNKAVSIDPTNAESYLVRSKVYIKKLEYAKAIDDISKNIISNPDNPEMYLIRGTYYQEFTQHMNAINDFTKAIMLDENNPEAYYKRAYSYEQIANYKAAIKDYQALTKLSEYDVRARKLLDEAKDRMYELNREGNKPQITLLDPPSGEGVVVKIAKNATESTIKGLITDESDLKSLKINGVNVPFIKTDDGYEFQASIKVSGLNMFSVAAEDIYSNLQNTNFTIERTEVEAPTISLIAPYASDNNEIYLDNEGSTLYVEGQIMDESLVKTILIDGVSASFKMDEFNPRFTANINIANKGKITVRAIDEYGNEKLNEYIINREGIKLSENNPMGKTWVIFIENSNYKTFASLQGPTKDVTLMRSALAKYKIHKIIHKQNMTKKEIEKFFSIDLRDMVRSNRVNALLIWYAGHGKFINETGYWIPTDAKRDDEFTYYNINALRASLESYTNYVTHTLVITDACESGPTFYQAMRSGLKERSCDDWEATRFKSSQVFSSAGYELAIDNSQFTRTFANTLLNNPNSCIPIEAVVNRVTKSVVSNNQQKPQFGKISGLKDEDGTFFFVAQD